MWMHALHYTNPDQQRQYVPEPLRSSLSAPANTLQHNPYSVHGTNLFSRLAARLLVLLACHLLSGHIRMLRGLCDRLILRSPLPLHRTDSPRPEGLFPRHSTKGLGPSDLMDEEMLRGREGAMANAKERIDLVQHHLDGRLPILLHQGLHDHHCGGHAVLW